MSYLMVVFKNAVSDFFGGEIAFDVIAHFFFIDKPHYFKQTIFPPKLNLWQTASQTTCFLLGYHTCGAPQQEVTSKGILLF